MARSLNLERGFLFLYDWVPALENLPGKEVKILLIALLKRQRDNEPFPLFSNPLTASYARMIEPVIERRLRHSAAAKKGHTNPSDCGE